MTFSSPAAPHQPPSTRGLFINGLGLGQLCSWGSLYYSFPLIAQAMSADLGWSKAELYGAATLGLGLAGLAAYPVGVAIDRGYGRAVMTGGSLAAGLLLVLWAHIESLALFYVAVAGIGAMQAATLYDPAFAVVARKAGPAHARAGITALTMWGGFASTVFIPLIQLLLDHVGWRDTLIILGAINIVVCGAVNFATIDTVADAPVRRPAGEGEPKERSAIADAIRQPAFWALAVAFTAYAAMFSGFTFHAYPLLIERGFDTATVVGAIAMIGPAQVTGRLAVWLFAPRTPVRLLGSVIVAVFPLAFLALELMPPDFTLVALFALGFGAVNGIITIVRGLVVPELITRRAYGAVNGALAVPATVSRALAPAGLAMLWTASGSYDAVLMAIIAGSLVLAAGFWTAAALAGAGPED
ncbi:MFS transporter [Ancylobacter mangrovi]|uniref:MFS transporter n=1 Tax=Ancylobacter mangrovi TaxID=2972472 RepID=UPI002161435A|nr:MFS transporter [Ancylobacter mangrovi]MCS0502284.1 MFS transporter [Ancylobacter mangrovi]